MRIQSSISTSNYQKNTNQMKKTQNVQNKVNRQLASGKKVSSAADDAAVLSISQKLLKQIGSLSQGGNNIQSGVNLIKIADGAMNSISESIGDLEVNAVRAMNGTLSDGDRKILQQSNEATIGTIEHVKGATQYNGKRLLDGSTGDISIHTGSSSSSISGVDVSAKTLGLTGFSVEDPSMIDTGILDHAMIMLSSTRSTLGAQQNGLESAYRSNQIAVENTTVAESRMTDTDMFDAFMKKETNHYIGAAQVLMMRNQMKQNENMVSMMA